MTNFWRLGEEMFDLTDNFGLRILLSVAKHPSEFIPYGDSLRYDRAYDVSLKVALITFGIFNSCFLGVM